MYIPVKPELLLDELLEVLELLEALELEEELLVELEDELLEDELLEVLLLDDELLVVLLEELLPLSDWAPHAPSARALRQIKIRITVEKGMCPPGWFSDLTTRDQDSPKWSYSADING